jgi:iron complex outermembrane recepter protein
MFQKYMIAVCLFLNMSALMAQITQVKGKIETSDGQPAQFVTVILKELNKGTETDENGIFSIKNVKSGQEYTLVASFVGLKTQEKKVLIEGNQAIIVDFSLIENAQELEAVIVKATQGTNQKVASIGKINIKPMDLPQSVATIDRATLDNQQAITMSDVLMNANGVYIMGTTGGYQESIAGRGFAYGNTNTFKNGVRYFNGMMSELSGVEKVELMKGSSAILFGNVAAGGILNLVSKKPKFEHGGEVGLRIGSFGLLKPTFDIYGGIGKSEKLAFRLNGSYEKANSFRQGVTSERYFVNPSVLVKLGKKTTLLLEADYMDDNRTPDFGAGIINYQIVDLPRERFLGVAWSYFKSMQLSSSVTVTHQFSDNWNLAFTGAYRNYSTDLFANTRPNSGSLITKEGLWIRNIQRSEVKENYYLGQVDLTGKFNTGKVAHQLLFGFDTDQFETNTTAYTQLSRYDTINIYGVKTYSTRTDIPNLNKNTLTTSPVSRFGAYVQDLISINKYIKLLAGIRYSYQQTGSDVLTYATNKTTNTVSFNGAFSPRLGVVVQPTKNHSIFASYANSFTVNTGIDVSSNALPPSIIDQYEVGVKNELLDGKLTANVTAYRILNNNLAQISLANGNTNTNIKELAGSVQSEGIELDFTTRPLNSFSIMAGYSYNETKYVKSNTYIEGSLLLYNPKHTANLSGNYGFTEGALKGFTLGLIGVYIGKRYAGRLTRVQVNNDAYRSVALPDYTQIDAVLGYQYKNFFLRGKIGNVFNVLSYNVHDDNSVNPIAPRNFSTSLVYKF